MEQFNVVETTSPQSSPDPVVVGPHEIEQQQSRIHRMLHLLENQAARECEVLLPWQSTEEERSLSKPLQPLSIRERLVGKSSEERQIEAHSTLLEERREFLEQWERRLKREQQEVLARKNMVYTAEKELQQRFKAMEKKEHDLGQLGRGLKHKYTTTKRSVEHKVFEREASVKERERVLIGAIESNERLARELQLREAELNSMFQEANQHVLREKRCIEQQCSELKQREEVVRQREIRMQHLDVKERQLLRVEASLIEQQDTFSKLVAKLQAPSQERALSIAEEEYQTL